MEFWKIQILKNYLKIEICFGKLFKKWNFENWIWKLEFWKSIWKLNFEELFENEILKKKIKNF